MLIRLKDCPSTSSVASGYQDCTCTSYMCLVTVSLFVRNILWVRALFTSGPPPCGRNSTNLRAESGETKRRTGVIHTLLVCERARKSAKRICEPNIVWLWTPLVLLFGPPGSAFRSPRFCFSLPPVLLFAPPSSAPGFAGFLPQR